MAWNPENAMAGLEFFRPKKRYEKHSALDVATVDCENPPRAPICQDVKQCNALRPGNKKALTVLNP